MNPRELHTHVHNRFCEVFGTPHNTLAQAAQWSLGPGASGPPMHVLLNGAADQTSVWIFDPHGQDGAAPVTPITAVEQTDGVIAQILHLLNRRPMTLMSASSAALLSQPTRITGFVRGIYGWSDCITVGAADAARLETEKARIFGRFLIEDEEFADAYIRNRDKGIKAIESLDALTCTCTILNAVADLVAAGAKPSPGTA